MQIHFWEKPSIDAVRFWLGVMDIDEMVSSFVWLWNLLQLKPDIERYEALVYHMSYRALPVENKIDNGFLAYVVDLFCDKLDSIPDEGRYTALFLCIQMELYPSALLCS